MPYTPPENRDACDIYELQPPDNEADLCYIVARLLTRYTEMHGISFATFGDIRNAVFGAYEEFKNVVIDPYERVKRVQNRPDIWGTLPKELYDAARSPLEECEV